MSSKVKKIFGRRWHAVVVMGWEEICHFSIASIVKRTRNANMPCTVMSVGNYAIIYTKSIGMRLPVTLAHIRLSERSVWWTERGEAGAGTTFCNREGTWKVLIGETDIEREVD